MNQKRNPKRNLKYFELNEIENATYWNLSDAVKAELGVKFIALDTFTRN